MNAHADITSKSGAAKPDAAPDPLEARSEVMLRKLARLSEIGMELAETLAAQAKGQRDLQDVAERAGVKSVIKETIVLEVRGDFGAVLAKVARAVRLTIMLEDRLLKDRRLRAAGREAEHVAALEAQREALGEARRAEEAVVDERRVVARQTAIDEAVKDVIRAERPEGFDREVMFTRLEHVWESDFYADTLSEGGGDEVPVSKQVAAFCRRLKLEPDWELWRECFWAIEEAADEEVGSPYAGRGTGPP